MNFIPTRFIVAASVDRRIAAWHTESKMVDHNVRFIFVLAPPAALSGTCFTPRVPLTRSNISFPYLLPVSEEN